MNKKVILNTLLIIILIIFAECILKRSAKNIKNSSDNQISKDNEVKSSVKAIIHSKEYTINLEKSETVKSFVNLLPQEINMKELNGNEKYAYLKMKLPTDEFNPKRINRGDIMLYGNNCLVIFYESFDTSYSYTKIGHIDNLPNLGSGSIKVKFEKSA